MSPDCCVALPRGAMGLSAVCDCGISWSYSLTIFVSSANKRILDYIIVVIKEGQESILVGHQQKYGPSLMTDH